MTLYHNKTILTNKSLKTSKIKKTKYYLLNLRTINKNSKINKWWRLPSICYIVRSLHLNETWAQEFVWKLKYCTPNKKILWIPGRLQYLLRIYSTVHTSDNPKFLPCTLQLIGNINQSKIWENIELFNS